MLSCVVVAAVAVAAVVDASQSFRVLVLGEVDNVVEGLV